MKDAVVNCMKLGDSFSSSKHIVSLCFAEVAIQVSKNVVFQKRDTNRLLIVGIGFLCTACRLEAKGWLVTELFVNVQGKVLSSACKKSNIVSSSLLQVKRIIDLLFENICETPNLSNVMMRKLIKGYAPDYAITTIVLQKHVQRER